MEVDIAKLLNFNGPDSSKLENLLAEYFSEDGKDDKAGDCCDSDSAEASSEDEFDPTETSYESVMKNEVAESYVLNQSDDIDQDECEKATKFSCTCKYDNGSPCYRLFPPEEMMKRRGEMRELSPRDQMLVLLGKISCTINLSDLTMKTKRREQKTREHQRTFYRLEGKQLCRDTFKFLHCISQDRLTGLLKHYKDNGLQPKEKKNGGRKCNTRSFMFQDVQQTVQFLTNYARENALVLPGRVPGFKKDDINLLPSSHTKVFVYSRYKESLEGTDHRVMGSSSFFDVWKKLCPFIVTAKPMTDLCWTCQLNNTLIFRSANLAEEDKCERVKQQENHLFIVQKERSLYNKMVGDARSTCQENTISKLCQNSPCSRKITMHYSFDYAQQVHLPSNPLLPGPIYFLVPRKYGLFGVCCEGIPQQVNFLVDEAHLISKGSNAVISYLHYFLNNYGTGETEAHFHCDNCSGQNKNRFVLWYFAWRVAVGLHKSVSLNFLIAGHTKFAPDWCFGLLKRAVKRNLVPAQSVLETVVNESSSVNIAQVVGYEDGTTVVPVSDWQTFFKNSCKPLPGIKKYQDFRFDDAHPGSVFVKQHSESEETEFNILLSDATFPRGTPEVIAPPGLPLQRQQYLYKSIREYVDEPYKDIVCPKPEVLPVVESDGEDVAINETVEELDAHEHDNRAGGKARQRGQRGRRGRGRGQGDENAVHV